MENLAACSTVSLDVSAEGEGVMWVTVALLVMQTDSKQQFWVEGPDLLLPYALCKLYFSVNLLLSIFTGK